MVRRHRLGKPDASGLSDRCRRQIIGERAFAHRGAGLADLCTWFLSMTGAEPAVIAVAIEVPHGPIVGRGGPVVLPRLGAAILLPLQAALLQDAAYGTLLRIRRQELHARVAAVLELHFPDLIERQPELLAHHLTAAGETERAVHQWLKAGQHAAERSSHIEAIRHFERGLATLAALPEGQARDRQEIELQLARGLSLFTIEGFFSVEAARAYTRARKLAAKQGDPRQLFTAVYGLWQSAHGTGRVRDCRSFGSLPESLSFSVQYRGAIIALRFCAIFRRVVYRGEGKQRSLL
jgi:hypothetical protein